MAGRWLLRHAMTLGLVLAAGTVLAARPSGEIGKDWGDPEGEKCVECHLTENPV